jgi:uncharacterized protein involved in exopolysaccharide biosynthesis
LIFNHFAANGPRSRFSAERLSFLEVSTATAEATRPNPEESVSEKTHIVKLFLALRLLWHRKIFIILGTLVFTVAGVTYSLMAPPVYLARAVIYPKDISANSDKSGLGGSLSGALNPVLGISHLNRVEILMKSREMARRVILKEKLLPILLPEEPAEKTGKSGKVSAEYLEIGAGMLKDMVSTRVDVYQMTIELKVRAQNPVLASRIAGAYLDALNERMKEYVIRSADANRTFLETQMSRTSDPSTREKIQELIIREIETSMLLNASGFELLEAPEVPHMRESPNRKRIVLVFMVLGFLVSCFAVLALHAFAGIKAELKPYAL